MIENDFTEYCYLNILDIYFDDKLNERKKLIRSFNVLKEFLLKLDEDNQQIFSSFYQRLHFIIANYKLPKQVSSKLHSLRFFVSKLAGDKSISITPFELDLRLCDLFQVIKLISKVDFPANVPFLRQDIVNENRSLFYEKLKKQKGDKVPFLRATLVSVASVDDETKTMEIDAKNEHYEDIKIQLKDTWFEHPNMYPEGALLNLFDIGFDGKTYYTHWQSLVSLEPDFLIDVTDIADCFGTGKANPNLYFLSKFTKSGINEAATVGNLVNHIFDELLSDPEVDFDSAFERGLNIKPLQIMALLNDKVDLPSIRERVARQYHTLKLVISRFGHGKRKIEPSFVSANYGLQGRLDLLIDDGKNKSVVELKSGKAPNRDVLYSDIDGKKYMLSIWKNHVVQAICYNMLLESAYSDSTVLSSILYSSSSDRQLRNVPNILQLKKEVLKCRNYIVAVEKAFCKDNYSVFRKFNVDAFGYYPNYKHKAIDDFAMNFNSFSTLEREYLYAFTGFISREIFSRKIGQSSMNKGYSSLWLDSIEEKEDNYSILRFMKLERDESNFDKMHIVFSFAEPNSSNNFRKGDICVAYHIPKNGKMQVIAGQMLKGSIREIGKERIVISFRNKLNHDDFALDYEWAIEPDSIDSLNKKLYASVYSLLNSGKNKRDVLLGIAEPKFKNIKKEYYPELNELQHELLYSALAAQDYYLLQGPPGTGKTSFLLRAMVSYLFDNSEENILVLAYTNMAADEICASLKRIDDEFPFLRLGGKESTDFPANLIASIAETENISSLYYLINKTRVFVSTVASALTNPEILKIKKFSTVIIDEASQISEPYLFSILCNADRFIMIGDEKQLPAVVTQAGNLLNVQAESLCEISLTNLGLSYFERLLANAKRRNWHNCYGMLTHQARMNTSIMQLSNYLFYDEKLLLSEKRAEDPEFEGGTYWLDYLAKYDIIFVDTPVDRHSKINTYEAKIAAELTVDIAHSLGDGFNKSSLGIISPFRAQVVEIQNQIGEELLNYVKVDTVERFQGSERDVIIFSFATNHIFDIDLITNTCLIDDQLVDRKLNVAITRARQKLVLLGNVELLKSSEIFNKLIQYVENNFTVIKRK